MANDKPERIFREPTGAINLAKIHGVQLSGASAIPVHTAEGSDPPLASARRNWALGASACDVALRPPGIDFQHRSNKAIGGLVLLAGEDHGNAWHDREDRSPSNAASRTE